jgi:hypothetical protein
MLRIIATRDGVCAADDLDAHEEVFTATDEGSVWRQLRAALASIEKSGYLPYSEVWVVRSGDVPVAVIADHWPLPEMVHTETTLPNDRLTWGRDQFLTLHFQLHDDHFTPPGDAKLIALRRIAEEQLAASRAAEGVV